MFPHLLSFFFFNDTATTEIYPLSLHDALPILRRSLPAAARSTEPTTSTCRPPRRAMGPTDSRRSEEHTSELQSRLHLVCRLLLEKKNTTSLTRTRTCSITPPSATRSRHTERPS